MKGNTTQGNHAGCPLYLRLTDCESRLGRTITSPFLFAELCRRRTSPRMPACSPLFRPAWSSSRKSPAKRACSSLELPLKRSSPLTTHHTQLRRPSFCVDAILFPHGEKTTFSIALLWTCTLDAHAPRGRCHTRTVWSCLPPQEQTRLPFGENLTSRTSPVCPASSEMHWPLATFQMRLFGVE